MRYLRALTFVAMLAVAACTPNGIGVASSGGGGGVTHVVDVNLTLNGPSSTPYGQSLAYKPAVLTVAVGDSIVFHNSDGFAHTATLIPPGKTANETAFPAAYPFSSSALTQTGSMLSSGNWSSGSMQAGAGSQTIVADKAGTYLYGCFYHYGGNMRGAIVAK